MECDEVEGDCACSVYVEEWGKVLGECREAMASRRMRLISKLYQDSIIRRSLFHRADSEH
jgi:hypothetical protein